MGNETRSSSIKNQIAHVVVSTIQFHNILLYPFLVKRIFLALWPKECVKKIKKKTKSVHYFWYNHIIYCGLLTVKAKSF